MNSHTAVLVFIIGYYLSCTYCQPPRVIRMQFPVGIERLVNGEGDTSTILYNDKESKAFSRRPRDVHIPLQYTIYCGVPPVEIDSRFYRCDDGVIVALTTTESTLTTTTKTQGSCRSSGLLICNGKPYCGADQGYRCCGFGRYNPEYQTCCQYTSAKYEIHDDMPEKNYICCVLDVYKRGSSDIPCEHASSNDRFFYKPTNLKKLRDDQTLCTMNEHETQYVYKIDVDVQDTKGNRRYLYATISMWPWKPASKSKNRTDLRNAPAETGYMKIQLDKYSPWKKNLIGKSFLTITKKAYLERAIFFLDPTDNLYKWPKSVKKQKRISTLLKKIQRKCRRQKKQGTKRVVARLMFP